MIDALLRCSSSEDHVVNTQCREGSKTSAAVYTPLEGGIRSAPVSEVSHHSIMISGRPPAVEDSTRQLTVAMMLGSYPGCIFGLQRNLILQPLLIPQLDKFLQRILKRNQGAMLLCCWIISVSDIDRAGLLFLGTDD
jgi:hypothetical protein